MIGLNDVQKNIRNSLIEAIGNDDLHKVQDIFNNKENKNDDIQAVLSHEGVTCSHTVLGFAIMCLRDTGEFEESFEESVEIIELIWQEANQKTRDSVCDRVIESFSVYPREIYPNNAGICFDLEEVIQEVEEHKRVMNCGEDIEFDLKGVIQEVEEHKRVMDLDFDLQEAIKSLDVGRVEVALENCGEDIEKVLMRRVYRDDSSEIDYLLIYPLKVDYSKELNQDDVRKIKEITKQLLWNKAPPHVRDFWLESRKANEEGQDTGDNYIIGSLEERQGHFIKKDIASEGWLEDLIQEVKVNNLYKAIESFDVNQVEKALVDCGTDIEEVLMREVHWSDQTTDALLVYLLLVKYDRELNQDNVGKIKEITELLWNKAPPHVRDFWLESRKANEEGQDTIGSLEERQEMYANIAGGGWLEDLIKKVKSYKESREEELSNPVLENIEEKERIAQGDRKIAKELQNEEEKGTVDPTATLVSDSNTSPAPTTGNTAPGNNDAIPLGNKKKNAVDATATTSANGGTTSPAPTTGNTTPEKNDAIPLGNDTVDPTPSSVSTSTEPIADNKTPEKNDTTFWSEHKGKIALSATGLCVAGAVAAYVLAYPAVALALAVLAAVILIGAGIDKVLEDPSVEKTFTQQQKA